jgi:hypothetical protein
MTGNEEVIVMADPKMLYDSLSRRGAEGARSGSARRQRAVVFALVGILLAIALASQFMTSGNDQHPTTVVDLSHNTSTH